MADFSAIETALQAVEGDSQALMALPWRRNQDQKILTLVKRLGSDVASLRAALEVLETAVTESVQDAMLPPAAQLIDGRGAAWTLDSTGRVLRDGIVVWSGWDAPPSALARRSHPRRGV